MVLLQLRRLAIALVAVALVGCGAEGLTLPPSDGAPPGTGSSGGGNGGGGETPGNPTPPPSNPSPPATPAPNSMAPLQGGDQTAVAGADVPVPPAVRVVDSAGRPVSGFPVTFVVTRGGGTLLDPAQITGSDGVARVGRWTLGSPGLNTLEARAQSVSGSPVVFRATALARTDVDHFVFVRQPDGIRVNQEQEIRVAMVDAAGNVVPLSGIELYLGLFQRQQDNSFAVRNGLLRGDRFADTKDGIATFRLAVTEAGTYKFRVLSDELPELGPHGPEPYVFSSAFNVY